MKLRFRIQEISEPFLNGTIRIALLPVDFSKAWGEQELVVPTGSVEGLRSGDIVNLSLELIGGDFLGASNEIVP